MDEINNPAFRLGFLAICIAQQIRQEMFKNYRLTSDVISAKELIDTVDDAILDALEKMFQMQSQDEINAEWCEKMEFIQTVTQQF